MKIIQKPPCSEDKLMNKVINEQTEIKDWEEGNRHWTSRINSLETLQTAR